MIRKYYIAPVTESVQVRLEENFVYTVDSSNTNGDNNQIPVDGGDEDF